MLWLAALMIAALCAAPLALADSADCEYETTELFIEYLDEHEYKYSYNELDDDGNEQVSVKFSGDNVDPDVQLYFSEDQGRCSLRVWDVIEYDEDDEADVLSALNQLNRAYMYAKWTADADCSVTVAMDVILRPNDDMAEILFEAVRDVARIVEVGYPDIEDLAQ